MIPLGLKETTDYDITVPIKVSTNKIVLHRMNLSVMWFLFKTGHKWCNVIKTCRLTCCNVIKTCRLTCCNEFIWIMLFFIYWSWPSTVTSIWYRLCNSYKNIGIVFLDIRSLLNVGLVLGLWCLMPFSTIFQLFHVSGENHRPVASHWQTLSHNVVSSRIRTIIDDKYWFHR
jgi:hypothetical protein